MVAQLKRWAARLKRDILTLWVAAREPRVPLHAKIVAAAVAAYGLSPIDLIPDFIPVLGLLDDLLVLPAGIWLAGRMIPPPLMIELRARAETLAERPTSLAGAGMIVFAWAAILWWAWPV